MFKNNPALVPTVAGQISRLYLENFMTYDTIEIKPGYHLNLIIGPNGTGKSTIVCAVLLGLGGKLKTLGRADQLGSYVKTGCDQSLIEIELYDPKDQNITIRRQISSNNNSQFFVNGKAVTAAKVNEIRKQYNIQVDNLCTFLPQEKVQDFAKMNAQELLEQTQIIVGSGDISHQHEDLKKLRLNIINQIQHTESIKENLESEKQKNARLEGKVQTINEKRSLHEKITLLNQKKAWLTYHDSITKKKEVDNDTLTIQKHVDERKKRLDSINKELKKFEENIKEHQENLTRAKREETVKKTAVDDKLDKARRRVAKMEDLEGIIESRLAEESSKRQEMRRYEVNVDKLTNDLRTLDSTIGSKDDREAQSAEINKELRRNHDEDSRLTQNKSDLEEEERRLKYELRNAEAERRLLENRKNVRLEYLRKHEPDVFKGYEWLQQHRDMFQGHIYNPMLLELNVPNAVMAKYVECHISYRDLISFTCTCPEDVNLLVQKLRVQQRLRVNIVCSDENDCSQFQPPVPINRLRSLGFHSFLKDFITGPEPVLRYLCKLYKIHSVPVGDETTRGKCDDVPENIPVFFSENHNFKMKVSSYSGAKSISMTKIPEPRLFSASVDEDRIHELLAKEKQISAKVELKQGQIRELNKQLANLERELEEIRKRKRTLATSDDERSHIVSNLKRAQAQVEGVRHTLKDPQQIRDEVGREKANLEIEIAGSLEGLQKANQTLDVVIAERQRFDLVWKTSRFGIDDVKADRDACSEDVAKSQSSLSDMKERQRQADATCKRLKDTARHLTNGLSPGDRGFTKYESAFAELKGSVEELEVEVEETKARADFLQDDNLQVLQEYEKRESDIAEIEVALESSKAELEKKQEQLVEKKTNWLGPVNQLVEQVNKNFGHFFASMDCAGEVSLTTGDNEDDFNQYGIEIRVKFRDGVPLQVLGRFFQSGGERAVATAIYMLSLQELTSVPFRFVDEINQGMDPANERRILELIVRVTSPITSSQYFFITPKLLHDIECPETMSILCVYNGPSAIPATEWDVDSFLHNASQLQ